MKQRMPVSTERKQEAAAAKLNTAIGANLKELGYDA